jgi:tRNA (guanine-N7-)-methyltransferase
VKPEELKPLFSWEDRRVLINDRVWYVPERVQSPSEFVFPGWNHPDFFGNSNPVCVEYCSGNGAWVAAKALENPMINWVAVEKKYQRVRKIWSKAKNMKLNNLIILCGEAQNATMRYFPDASISDAFINFPDPWPKTRHAKHRLINHKFADELWRILKQGRSLTFVTDDPPYSEWLIKVMHRHGRFTSTHQAPYFSTELPLYGTSFFDQLWRSKGKIIRYHRFSKGLV